MTMHIPFNTTEAKENGFCRTGTSGSDTVSLAKHIMRLLLRDGCVVYVISESKAWAPPAQTPITNVITLQPHGIVSGRACNGDKSYWSILVEGNLC